MARTHVSNASIVFTIPLNGVMTQLAVKGNIYSVVKTTKEKTLNQFCPDCQEQIRYDVQCPNNHGPIDRATLLRGRKVVGDDGSEQVAIIEDHAEVVKSTIARGKLVIAPVTRESLTNGTTPNGTPYHFSPIPADTEEREAYAILYSVIADNPDWAFVTRANIGRGAETLIAVEPGAFGGLTLQSLAYPETLYDLPEYEVERMSKANCANIRNLVKDQVDDFDPDEWLDRQAAAIKDAVSTALKAPSRRGAAKVKKVKESKTSLLSAIAASAKAS
jgi:non-homologous end joining protein Ku